MELDLRLLLMTNGGHSLFADGLMSAITQASTWIPLYISLVYLVIKNNENMRQVVLIFCCAGLCVLLADGVSSGIIKPLIGRFRPSRDPLIMYRVDIVNQYRGGMYGFFSSHAANTFSIFVFMALLVKNRIFTIFMLSWTLLNCFSRLYLGVHYPGDIIVGLVWGGVVGLSVYYLLYRRIYKTISGDMKYISTEFTNSGYMLADVDVAISVLIYTYIYVIFRAVFTC